MIASEDRSAVKRLSFASSFLLPIFVSLSLSLCVSLSLSLCVSLSYLFISTSFPLLEKRATIAVQESNSGCQVSHRIKQCKKRTLSESPHAWIKWGHQGSNLDLVLFNILLLFRIQSIRLSSCRQLSRSRGWGHALSLLSKPRVSIVDRYLNINSSKADPISYD